MSRSTKIVAWIVLLMGLLALAQYLQLELQIDVAQKNFRNLGPELQNFGEKKFRERLVKALAAELFVIDPKDISITYNPTGTATIRLVTSREVKILFFTYRRDVLFLTEPIYSSDL